MPIPHKILEEYVFDVPGLGTVKGRLVEPVLPQFPIIYWQCSHICSAKEQNYSDDIETVRELLFQYVDKLDSSAKPDTSY